MLFEEYFGGSCHARQVEDFLEEQVAWMSERNGIFFGEVEDVVSAVLFLCSPGARYMTGQILHVNGGFYM